jgi:predicted nucleic acid-binding protein
MDMPLDPLVDTRDKYHQKAVKFLSELKPLRLPFYVSILIIAETYRQLIYRPYLNKEKALDFLTSIYDGTTNILYPCEQDEKQALEYIKRFRDIDLTFTDAITMAIMYRVGVRRIFCFDWHFSLLGLQIVPSGS